MSQDFGSAAAGELVVKSDVAARGRGRQRDGDESLEGIWSFAMASSIDCLLFSGVVHSPLLSSPSILLTSSHLHCIVYGCHHYHWTGSARDFSW